MNLLKKYTVKALKTVKLLVPKETVFKKGSIILP